MLKHVCQSLLPSSNIILQLRASDCFLELFFENIQYYSCPVITLQCTSLTLHQRDPNHKSQLILISQIHFNKNYAVADAFMNALIGQLCSQCIKWDAKDKETKQRTCT